MTEMSTVFRLAYVELATPSIERARVYYDGVLGATTTEQTSDVAYLSLGLDHHNLSLRQAERASLGAIGLQLRPELELAGVQARLRDLGLRPELKRDARPGVPNLLEIADVGGHTFHLVPDIAPAGPGFSNRGINPLRFGHLAILTENGPAVLRFLTEGLAFETTDWFEDVVTFVTCNRDHHVLNVIHAPATTLHHLAFELEGRDHQVRAADLLARHQTPTLWGPARHTAGHNIASYHRGADGALIELYNDMDVFVPELGYCEPRPWHGDLPQRPKRWQLGALSRWDTRYEFDWSTAALGSITE